MLSGAGIEGLPIANHTTTPRIVFEEPSRGYRSPMVLEEFDDDLILSVSEKPAN